MRLLWLGALIGALLAVAPGAAAQCSSSANTTDLGAAQVNTYEDGCTYNWGTYGYEYKVRGVGVTSGDTSANAEVWRWHTWNGWTGFSYDGQDVWGSVYASSGGKTVQVDAGAEIWHVQGPGFCTDYLYGWLYVPSSYWGGWWGSGPGNNVLPPMDSGFWLGTPCTGALPVAPPV